AELPDATRHSRRHCRSRLPQHGPARFRRRNQSCRPPSLRRRSRGAGGRPRPESLIMARIKTEATSAELFAPEADFPDFSHEEMLMARGARLVAGVDEAGRGPLAGPVVVAAVRLDPARIPTGLNDSKKLTPERRDALYDEIVASAEIAIVSAPPSDILALNIRGATL